jgi:(1->4)-alpha-D-glucan 1-alpha-D-glucosylmutase
MIPRATYGVQFGRDFRFAAAAAIAPYLQDLGIRHVYASPYLQGKPGSMHGYDVANHNEFNSTRRRGRVSADAACLSRPRPGTYS